jgi:hypothetical protein
MVRQLVRLMVMAVLIWPLTVGCNIISVPFVLFAPDPTKKIPAEFAKIEGKRVLILVWAEQATLYEYPHVQLESATHIRYFLREKFKDLDVVSPTEVERYMQGHPDWSTEHPARLGRQFKADFVMMVELMEFSTREPGSPGLFRGRVRARVTVYDLSFGEEQPNGISLKPAEAVYPPDKPIGVLRADDRTIRAETYKEFGRNVAQKFYEHEVKL